MASLEELRRTLSIPVWHDDQQGTATVVLAGLLNALKVVGKDPRNVRIALIGAGAAGIAIYRLLCAYGLDPRAIVVCDSQGVLHPGRRDIAARRQGYREKWQICEESNLDGITGSVAEALRGADVCLAFSRPGPGVIRPEWVTSMARDAIVFACANPVPEIWPWDAKDAGARIVATGRSDFPNQVNNSLAFPGIFRGVLDVRAKRISEEMAIAAAEELAAVADGQGLADERILPGMGEVEVAARVAVASGMKAQEQGLAGIPMSRDDLHACAIEVIRRTRAATELLMRERIIPSPD